MFCLINSTKALFLFLRTDGSKVDAASVMTLGTSVSEMSDSQLDAIDSVSIAISYVNNMSLSDTCVAINKISYYLHAYIKNPRGHDILNINGVQLLYGYDLSR